MCLLIVLSRVVRGAPLVAGANRDELYERPALPMTVLRSSAPRTLGGRDLLAGGTWLAVNEAGVFTGVTNRPVLSGRDPAKRSRGELPLIATEQISAAAAVEVLETVDPALYNPCWLLVGDRRSLFAVDIAAGSALEVRELPPGLHVLENRPMGEPSFKVDGVRAAMAETSDEALVEVERRLQAVLSDHRAPPARPVSEDEPVPPAVQAACVHTERYGTRWSAVLTVPEGDGRLPALRYSDGAPCSASYRDAAALWYDD